METGFPGRRTNTRAGADPSWASLKTRVPTARAGMVLRHELIARMRSVSATIVSVAAAGGYGKTTFLTQWAAADERRIAWLSLDAHDDDPAALVSLLAGALSGLVPGVGPEIGTPEILNQSPVEIVAPRLAARLATAPLPFVLFLDDVHEIRSAAGRAVLETILPAIPAGSTVVLAGRNRVVRIAAHRAAGRVLELDSDDLRLGAAGARTVFRSVGADTEPGLVEAALARTEGWPAGLHMWALMLRSGDDDEDAAGSRGLIAAYLERCLAASGTEARTFLRRASVLDTMSGPLCDAALARTGSGLILAELAAQNLFIVPIDREGALYRCHPLMRDFLLEELRETEPERERAVRRRAARRYLAGGSPREAIEQLLEAGADDEAVRIIADIGFQVHQSGQAATLSRWLATVGPDTVAGCPDAVLLVTWVEVCSGAPDRAEPWLRLLDELGDATPTLRAGRALARAAMNRRGIARSIRDAQRSVEEVANGHVPWILLAMRVLGQLLALDGQDAAARAQLRAALRISETHDSAVTEIVCRAELADIALREGDVAQASRELAEVSRVMRERELQGYSASAVPLALLARFAARNAEFDEAAPMLERTLALRPFHTGLMPYLAVRMRVQAARAALLLDRPELAAELLREIEEIADDVSDLGRTEEDIALVRGGVEASAGRPADARLTRAELRVLGRLPSHLTLDEIAARIGVSRSTVSTHVRGVYRKLGATSRTEAVEAARRRGLVEE